MSKIHVGRKSPTAGFRIQSAVLSHYRAAGLLACLALPMLANAQSAALPTYEDFNDGDRWQWRQVDNLTNLEEFKFGRHVEKVGEAAEIRTGGKNRSLSEIYVTGWGQGIDPSKPWRAWPLAIGKKWQFASTWTSMAGTPGWTNQNAEVVAYEEVTVPAGKFMAFRIEHRGNWHTTDIHNKLYEGPQSDTYWYAPDVRVDVKHVIVAGNNHFTQELISYKRGQP